MNLFDTTTAPTSIPKTIVRGDFTAWRLTGYISDYPEPDYSIDLVMRLEGDSQGEKTVSASVLNDEHLFQIPAATSAQFDAGKWFWSLFVTRSADLERATLDTGRLSVLHNRDEDPDDPRSLPRQMLAKIEAAMLHRATNQQLDTLAYSLGVESSGTRNPAVLIEHRTYWRKELVRANRRWRARNGRRHSGTIKVRI